MAKDPRLHPHRKYIGLSGIGMCDQVLYDRFKHGNKSDQYQSLKFALGYGMEDYVVGYLESLGLYQEGIEIVLHDGLVRGHPDGTIDNCLLEIKSVPQEHHIPKKKLPHKVWWQIQAYMLYGEFHAAYVVYLSRDTGLVRVLGAEAHRSTQQKIMDKVARLVVCVRRGEQPLCTCGRCFI